MIKRDYRDNDGILHRVLIPTEDVPFNEGIPLSLDIDVLYTDTPLQFRIRLVEGLFNRGLIEPGDFFKAGAAELTRAAILEAAKFDALDILSFAKRKMTQ